MGGITPTKRLLITATVAGHIRSFHLPLARKMVEDGWTVDVATFGELSDPAINRVHQLDWTRTPFSAGNVRAYQGLKRLIDREYYDVVYCHTPVGGAVTRLAARRARKSGTRVIYMAHGFHFYKGAPFLNWLIYFPAEWLLAHFMDDLLTINSEDYERAARHFSTSVHKTNGVGVDLARFSGGNLSGREAIRAELGIAEDEALILVVGELNANKNQRVLIEALAEPVLAGRTVHLALAGSGPMQGELESLVESLHLTERVHFLGYRTDVPDLLGASDLAASASKREGLGLNVIEALASGKFVVASDNRGHRDLIRSGENSLLVGDFDPEVWAQDLFTMLESPAPELDVESIRDSARKYDVAAATSAIASILEAHR